MANFPGVKVGVLPALQGLIGKAVGGMASSAAASKEHVEIMAAAMVGMERKDKYAWAGLDEKEREVWRGRARSAFQVMGVMTERASNSAMDAMAKALFKKG